MLRTLLQALATTATTLCIALAGITGCTAPAEYDGPRIDNEVESLGVDYFLTEIIGVNADAFPGPSAFALAVDFPEDAGGFELQPRLPVAGGLFFFAVQCNAAGQTLVVEHYTIRDQASTVRNANYRNAEHRPEGAALQAVCDDTQESVVSGVLFPLFDSQNGQRVVAVGVGDRAEECGARIRDAGFSGVRFTPWTAAWPILGSDVGSLLSYAGFLFDPFADVGCRAVP